MKLFIRGLFLIVVFSVMGLGLLQATTAAAGPQWCSVVCPANCLHGACQCEINPNWDCLTWCESGCP